MSRVGLCEEARSRFVALTVDAGSTGREASKCHNQAFPVRACLVPGCKVLGITSDVLWDVENGVWILIKN
jgi:hypothetical protein